MNIGKVEDEKKSRVDNIMKRMRQQWIPKFTKETSSNHGSEVLKKWVTPSPQKKFLGMNWSCTHQELHKKFQ